MCDLWNQLAELVIQTKINQCIKLTRAHVPHKWTGAADCRHSSLPITIVNKVREHMELYDVCLRSVGHSFIPMSKACLPMLMTKEEWPTRRCIGTIFEWKGESVNMWVF